mgnify:CR=1 FL=1|tara:strand:- start:556 stop:837 length:282 start_codon:yes stop_codon:yes gene_type:complete
MSKNINPVFLALARPPMCYGVTQSYLIAIFGFNMILFVITHSFLIILLFIALYGIGRICCYFEANYFEMLFKKIQFLINCPNSKYYGAISFEI